MNCNWCGKPKCLEKNVPQRHFVHYKFHMTTLRLNQVYLLSNDITIT